MKKVIASTSYQWACCATKKKRLVSGWLSSTTRSFLNTKNPIRVVKHKEHKSKSRNKMKKAQKGKKIVAPISIKTSTARIISFFRVSTNDAPLVLRSCRLVFQHAFDGGAEGVKHSKSPAYSVLPLYLFSGNLNTLSVGKCFSIQ